MDRASLQAYVCSLPERVIRSLSAIAGGIIRGVGRLTLPPRVRRTKLYDTLVDSTLRFLIEQVGQVDGAYPAATGLPDDFLIRRTAGNVLEAAGIVAFRASPVWVLAALADLSGAGRELIAEIAGALESEGLLQPGRRFETVDQLLDGLEATAGSLVDSVNTPPLDVAGLRQEWARFRHEARRLPRANLPSAAAVWSAWRELKQEAAVQQRTVFELSSAMALSALRSVPGSARWLSRAAAVGVRRTGEVLAQALLDHYRNTLAEIREAGYVRYWIREFQPYLAGALRQFSPRRSTTTERMLRRRQRSSKTPG
jgi:hypothetical protein